MHITWLDALRPDSPGRAAVHAAIEREAASRGWTLRTFFLPDIDIAPCAGDFKCWTDMPGTCAIDDANREIARAVIQCNVLMISTPVTFGGYSSDLKRAVDHLIQNITPLFMRVGGEMHHVPRYARYPGLLAIGTLAAPDEESAEVFRTLVRRNAINMWAPTTVAVIVDATQPETEIASAVTAAFTQSEAAA